MSTVVSRFQRARRLPRNFLQDRRGNLVVMGALLLLPLTFLAGGAADYARARQVRSELQDALDAAVLAGAGAELSTAAATAAFHTSVSQGVAIDPPAFTLLPEGRLSGSVVARSSNAFLTAGSIPHFTLHSVATAALKPRENDVCLTALDPTGPGYTHAGGAVVTAPECRFDVRSTGSPAASFMGSGSVSSKQICVKGANVERNGSAVDGLQLSCVMSKPYAGAFTSPSVAGCHAGNTNRTVATGGTIPAGTYCGTTILEGGVATVLQPNGVFVLRGVDAATPGRFVVRGSGSLTGDGVLLYFHDASTLTMEGTGELRLSAPTSGAHQGVLFHEAAGLPNSSVRITRSGAGYLKGVVNLPSRNLFIASSGATTADEVTLVVNRLVVEGSSTWSFKSAPPSIADRLAGTPYLVE